MSRAKACDIIIDMKPFFGHCGIVTGNFNIQSNTTPNGMEVIHATKVGILETAWENGKAYCFRAVNLSRTEAQKIQHVSNEIKGAAEYGASRAIFKSWAGSSSFDSSALARLEKYQTRMTSHQGVLKNVYCSELVVISYQLGLDINRSHLSWIDLDGKHTLPSTLKSWLEKSPTRWQFQGYVNDATLALSQS